jgi:hypothetical protein
MSDRERKAAVIAHYFQCVVGGRLSELPVTEDYGSESPQSGLLYGEQAINYLGEIGAEMRNIHVVRHIVDGDFVATYFEETTAKGVIPVVGLFEFKDDKIRFVRVFFDSAHPAA